MQVTLDLPSSIASELEANVDRLPLILELGVRAMGGGDRTEYAGVADVMRTLATLPSPQEVLALRPSPALEERVDALLAKNRTIRLDRAEEREWQVYEYLEHLVRMAKAAARAKTRPSA